MDRSRRLRIEAIHLDQDDPKKCTAKKLERSGLIKCKSRISMAPKRGILLDPTHRQDTLPIRPRFDTGGIHSRTRLLVEEDRGFDQDDQEDNTTGVPHPPDSTGR